MGDPMMLWDNRQPDTYSTGGSLTPGKTRSFPYPGTGNIWNNTSRDDGALYSPGGRLVSYFKDL